MLWAILLILLFVWMMGFISGITIDYVHIPLFLAIVALLFQIEYECSNCGFNIAKKRYSKSNSRILGEQKRAAVKVK